MCAYLLPMSLSIILLLRIPGKRISMWYPTATIWHTRLLYGSSFHLLQLVNDACLQFWHLCSIFLCAIRRAICQLFLGLHYIFVRRLCRQALLCCILASLHAPLQSLLKIRHRDLYCLLRDYHLFLTVIAAASLIREPTRSLMRTYFPGRLSHRERVLTHLDPSFTPKSLPSCNTLERSMKHVMTV